MLKIPGFDKQALDKYFKNTGMAMVGKVGSNIIKMVMNIAIGRYLGKGPLGIVVGGITYVYLFSALATLGLDHFIVKELHEFPKNRDRILGTAFWMKFTASLCCIPLMWVAYQFLPPKGTPFIYILIGAGIGVSQAFNVIDSFFQSEVQSKYIMQVQVAGNLISAVIKLACIYFHAPLIYFVYAYTIDFLLLAIGYCLTYHRRGHNIFNWEYSYQLAKKLLNNSWPLIISGIMVSLYTRIDQLMIQSISGSNEAGAYSTVASFSEAWNFIPTVIITTLFPAILNARRDDRQRYEKRVQNLYDLMVYLSLPAAIVISFCAPLIYKVYTPGFAYAAPVLSVHIWSGIFVFLGAASGQILIAENHARLTFWRTGFGAIVNIVLNLILIPRMGMMGAAIATLVAYASSTMFVIFIPKVSKQGVMMFKSLFFITVFKKFLKT